jgi:hypothetical protein
MIPGIWSPLIDSDIVYNFRGYFGLLANESKVARMENKSLQTFNEIISYHGLVELPIKGRAFPRSNMQTDPLLVQLDWFFTSFAWTLKFPDTLVNPLARPTSDHIPCMVSIGTTIPANPRQTLYSASGRALTGSARERRDMGRAHQRAPAFSSVRFLFSFEFCSK